MVKKTIEFDGEIYESEAELVRVKGVEGLTVDTFQQRVRKGKWSVERALTHLCRGTLKSKDDYHELAETSVGSPSVVVGDELSDRSQKMSVAHYEPMIQAFVTDATHPALSDRVSLRRFHRGTDLTGTKRSDAPIE